jgi:hypothetical protein
MGCTEYELAADQICVAMPGAGLFGSAAAVAAQALRRALQARGGGHALNGHATSGNGITPQTFVSLQDTAAADIDVPGEADGTGSVTVILSGRRAELPLAALQYRQGRQLASLMADFDPVAGLPA